jgi:hypothetical protein
MINQITGKAVYIDSNKMNSDSFTSNASKDGCCRNQHSKLNLNNNILPAQDNLSSASFRLLKRKVCESKIMFGAVRSNPSYSLDSNKIKFDIMKGGRK